MANPFDGKSALGVKLSGKQMGANEGFKQLDSPRVTDLISFASVRIIPSLPPHSKHTTRHFRPTTPCSITTTCTHRPDFELHAGGGGGSGDGGGGGGRSGGGSSGGDAPEFAPLHKNTKTQVRLDPCVRA
ncbi:hypothetical protein HN011_008770 [Eciton burchellii]|nr:hypothetical protein HN011_008770 [Eciton burchellii]